MLFNSYVFLLVFLPCAVAGALLFARRSSMLASYWTLAASVLFYGAWDIRYLPLLLGSIAFNHACGQGIARGAGRRTDLLWLGIAANLALLGWFKYMAFFVESANHLLGASFRFPEIEETATASFYTFTQIAYLIDMHRDPVRYGFARYALFVTYFPHLVAGPILHHREMMPQFEAPGAFRAEGRQFAAGMTLLCIGLIKKTWLADGIAPHASPLFDQAAQGYAPGLFESWAGTFAYGLQLYFDFSAYSDMAVGLSAMLGIRMPANFDSPYKSFSLIEFWRRWHMTLSRFLRDYLYVPLGGNRKGPLRRYGNLMITMVLGGLWHGAGWTFLAWGAMHGAGLAANHLWRAVAARLGPMPTKLASLGRWAGFVLTTMFVFTAWVFFRAPDMGTARLVFRGLLGLNGNVIPTTWMVAIGEIGRWISAHDLGLPPSVRIWIVRHVATFDRDVPRGLVDVQNSGILVGGPQLGWIAALLAIAWFAPNTMQIMANTSAYLDRARPTRPTRMGWRPTFVWALGSSAMLFVALSTMTRISEFLYFRF